MNARLSHPRATAKTAAALAPITIGVLLDRNIQERWILDCVTQALAVSGARLTALAIASAKQGPSSPVRLHRVFDKLDAQLRCRNERHLSPVDMVAELALPPFRVDIIRRADRWCLDDAATASLQRCDVHVWLCFTASPPSRLPHCISRLGAWGIEIGEGIPATNIWAGAMEVGTGSPVTMVSIVDYAADGDGLLYRSFGATAGNSPRRNRLLAVRKAANLFPRLLERLTRSPDTLRCAAPATLPVPARYPALPAPTLPALARLSWRVASNWAIHRLPAKRPLEQWQIAYRFSDQDEPGCRFAQLRYLVPPRDRFWADPFAVEYRGRYFIFFEELPYRTGKGRLMAMEVFEHAEPGEAQVILERPYHLSYPFVFDWEGALYMVPETMENRTVELYRCEAFPHRWRLHEVLLRDVDAVDATLCRQGNRWWMFVNIADPGVNNTDELHLYWSATPFGPWTAHPRNPVISDVRCARPAGPLFSRGRNLYRPSQDCSRGYGHSVLINRVQVLSEDAYKETTVERIAPDWRSDILRVHTVGGDKRLRVMDCITRRQEDESHAAVY